MGAVSAGAGIPVLLLFFFGIWGVLFFGGFAVYIWALVDAAKRPDWAFDQAGSNKVLWIVLVAVLGPLLGLIYLLAIRPGVSAVELAGPRWGWTAAPPPGAWAPAPPPQYASPYGAPGATGPARLCPACAVAAGPDDGFCRNCGAALPAGAAS